MSKRLGIIDPFETLDIYGVDACRWYMISNGASGITLNLMLMVLKK